MCIRDSNSSGFDPLVELVFGISEDAGAALEQSDRIFNQSVKRRSHLNCSFAGLCMRNRLNALSNASTTSISSMNSMTRSSISDEFPIEFDVAAAMANVIF